MKLSEQIEEHPLRFIFGGVVAAGSVVAAVMGFLWSEHISLIHKENLLAMKERNFAHSQELSNLNGKIRAIERRLGGQKYLDIYLLLDESNEERQARELELQYYEVGHYFAAHDPNRWEVRKIHEANLHEEILGQPRDKIYPPHVLQAMSEMDTVLWRGKKTYVIDGSKYITKIFPYILVQSIPYDLFPTFFYKGKMINSRSENDVGSDIVDPEHLEAMQLFVHSDASGIFATKKLTGIMNLTAADQNINYRLRNFQKKGPVLYAQVIYSLNNVTVDGVKKNEFFIVNEWILLARENDLLAIEIVNPALDPAFDENHFVDANLWLASFHIARRP